MPTTDPTFTRDYVIADYRRRFNRTPSEEEINVHLRNPGGQTGFNHTQDTSLEWAKSPVRTGGTFETPGDWTTDESTSAGTTPPGGGADGPGLGSIASGNRVSGVNFGGYDFDQDAANRDVTKSAKYALPWAMEQAAAKGATNSWGTKDGAEQYARTYLAPLFEQQGYKVLEIKGDKMRVVTREDYENGNDAGSWVDWVIGADGDNPQIGWQVESGMGADYTAPAGQTPRSWSEYRASLPAAGGGGATSESTPRPDGISDEAYYELYNRDRTLGDIRI